MAIGASSVELLPSYVVPYADHIEADLGVEVRLRKYARAGWQSSEVLDLLRNSKDWRAAVSEAEVVTISIGSNDVFWMLFTKYGAGQCGGEDNMDCIRERIEAFKANYDAIIAEILSLCQPGAIIRTTTFYYGSLAKMPEQYRFVGDLEPFLEPVNDIIVQAASENGIPVALVHLAFNGPDGDQDPAQKGYTGEDDLHVSELGATVIADLFRDLGYESTCP